MIYIPLSAIFLVFAPFSLPLSRSVKISSPMTDVIDENPRIRLLKEFLEKKGF